MSRFTSRKLPGLQVNDIISAEQVTLVTDKVFSGGDEGKAREW